MIVGHIAFDLDGKRFAKLTRIARTAAAGRGVSVDEYAKAIVSLWVDKHEAVKAPRRHDRSAMATKIIHYFSKLDPGDRFTLVDVANACPGRSPATVSSQMRVLRKHGEISYRRVGQSSYERL